MSKKGGHHGGAWKVAYADFITAMMALFLVLWLTSQDEKIKEAVQRAFRNPYVSLSPNAPGSLIGGSQPTPNHPNQTTSANTPSTPLEMQMLLKLKQELANVFQQPPEEEKSVELELTPEGMRLTIHDLSSRPSFKPNSPELTEFGTFIFTTVAWQLAQFSNNSNHFNLELEGHTESGFIPPKPEYTAWELTSDRANRVRRMLNEHGVDAKRFRKVAGMADTVPIPKIDLSSEANRRVTVLLKLTPGGMNF
jgi:chemotaxis protein MotB